MSDSVKLLIVVGKAQGRDVDVLCTPSEDLRLSSDGERSSKDGSLNVVARKVFARFLKRVSRRCWCGICSSRLFFESERRETSVCRVKRFATEDGDGDGCSLDEYEVFEEAVE